MSNTSKQVKQIAIQLGTYNAASETPFTTVVDTILYDVWNFDGRWRTDWLGGNANTRSLSGFDRVGAGGFRLDLRITFQNTTPTQGGKLRTLLNNIFTVPEFPRIIKVSPDAAIGNGEFCNIRSAAFGIRRELTIGRQAVNMQLTGLLREDTIPDTFVIGSS